MSDDYLWDGSGPPDDEIRRLEEVLEPLRYDGPPPEPAPVRDPWLLRVAAVAAAFLIVLVGVQRDDEPNLEPHAGSAAVASGDVHLLSATWAVADVVGRVRIGDRQVTECDTLQVGQWLETGDDASLSVAVADIGRLDVGARSRLRIRNTGDKEHRIQLAHGRISARVDAPPRLFLVDTAAATAVDLGCAYTLEVDDSGDGRLDVTSGAVALELGDRAAIVPAGATCEMRARLGPGTPHFTDAPERLRTALTAIDYQPQCGSAPVQAVLESARERDSLTLWHLLRRLPQPDRGAVFDRLNALSEAPEGVTRDGVLGLDADMLDRWRVDLDWDW